MKKQRRSDGGGAPPPTDAPAPAVHEDPRFAAVHSNPRFARFPKARFLGKCGRVVTVQLTQRGRQAKSKVEIDQRFSGVFSDPKFKRQTVVDKRGRATGAKERTDDLRRFYRLPDEDAAGAEEAALQDDDDGDDASASDLSDEHGAAPAVGREGARRGIRGSVSVSSSSSDEDEESEEEGSGEEGVLAQFVSGEEDVPLIDATYRLAVVDLEWDRMRAVDVFAVLRSFLPNGGRIVRVTVYPSDFGLARMKEEEEHGPRGAFASAGDGDSEDEETATLDAEKLRVYERERLRFYYAIVECDSAATAAGLYKQCDGLEFERSSTRLDLRYVPDEQTFEGKEPRDIALAVPAEYTPVDYTTKALQQTRVTLTWDADDPERKKQLRRKLTSEQLRDEDFAAYLGSGSEDEQDEDEAAARLRGALLGDAAAEAGGGGKRSANAGSDEDGAAPGKRVAKRPPRDDDMVVTFGMGLEERIAAKRAAAVASPETVWQAHLRERKEKKRAAKNTVGAAGGELRDGDAAGAGDEDLGFNDPFFASADDGGAAARRKKKRGHDSEAAPAADAATARDEARRRAELELLLLDDARLKAGAAPLRMRGAARENAAVDGDAAQMSRKEARAAAKATKKAARLARTHGGTDGDGAELNTADTRFSALFERPEFALDPTDSRFKAVRSVEVIRREAAARRAAPAGAEAAGKAHAASDGDLNLTSVVAKLKRKAGAMR